MYVVKKFLDVSAMNFKNLFLSTLAIGILFGVTTKTSIVKSENISDKDREDMISYQQSSEASYSIDYQQAISHELQNASIRTTFAPQNSNQENIELTQLASSLGFDHFNWVSYVELDPYGIADKSGKQMVPPYVDPPMGGYEYDVADNLPFYWDLVHCDRCKLHYHFKHPQNLNQYELTFMDVPKDYRLQPGESIKFITSLVGVSKYDHHRNKAEWQALHTFRWELKNIGPNNNQVSLIDSDVQLDELSPILIEAMKLNGGKSLPQVY